MTNNIYSYFYKFIERILTHGTTFIISIILARLLKPSDYGILSIITVFISFSQIFIEAGISTALIQKESIDDFDYRIMSSIMLFFSLFVYIILYFISSKISIIFSISEITGYIKILALMLFPSVYVSIIKSKLIRKMKFKIQMYATVISSILSGITGIILAYYGLGIWALIIQQIANQIILLLLFIFFYNWFPLPTLRIQISKIMPLYKFGLKVMFSNLLIRLRVEFSNLIIGKFFSPSQLGYFNRGKQFPQVLAENVESTVQSVLFPILSRKQCNINMVKNEIRNIMIISNFWFFFFLSILASTSNSIIKLLLTDTWNNCIIYVKLWCLSYTLALYNVISSTAINAIGKSNVTLKKQSYITFPMLITIFLAAFFSTSPIYIVASMIIFIPISFLLTGYYLKKELKYDYSEQLRDIVPQLLISLIIYVISDYVNIIHISMYSKMLIQLIVCFSLIIILSLILKVRAFSLTLNILKNHIIKLS